MTITTQPLFNVGIVGHVDHGKTTLTKLLSGRWTDTHSEEKKRGITIKLGYVNFVIYYNKEKNHYSTKAGQGYEPLKKLSIVDAPGHENLMATMISGVAVMDCALLVVAANEQCPQLQTIEHLKTLEIMGVKNVIIIQNKIDLISKEDSIKNYQDIKKFLKGTFAENAPIIPMSAQHSANISVLLEYVAKIELPQPNVTKKPLMYIVRSFDVNKPGDDYKVFKGGILGGTLKEGEFKVGDKIEIKPGIQITREGKTFYKPIPATIEGLMSDKDKLEKAIPGGSVGVLTKLDPTLTHADMLVGQVAGLAGTLPDAMSQIALEVHLFKTVMMSEGEVPVKEIILHEPLMLMVGALATVGVTSKANPKEITVNLKKPVMAFKGERVILFKKFEGNKWKIAGFGVVK